MKILVIDDQKLILISVKKRLTELGYMVETADSGENGIALFQSFAPDLVVLDINMPIMGGLEVVKKLRASEKTNTPIIVMSGNTQENTVLEGFDLGIDDYMKKPVSLNELHARIVRLLGPLPKTNRVAGNNQIVGKHSVGVVIPCYNEEDRLSGTIFQDFAKTHLGYHLCFVNDGSTDNTLKVLEEIRKGNEEFISVYNCDKNGGKAEAVRLGMLHLAEKEQLNYIGFLDADLSTDFSDFDDMVNTLENSDYHIVSGSRINRMGAQIAKDSARSIISKIINLIIRRIIKMSFKDTQCGAKVMKKELVPVAFGKKFITRWLFDVELFIRLRKVFGKKEALERICEMPLKKWIHVDGSKLSMRDSVKIVGQLAKIAHHYRVWT